MKTWRTRLYACRWWIWGLFALGWTISLLYPKPQEALGVDHWSGDTQFWVGKSLHLGAYAVFAILSGGVRIRAGRRWLMMFFLMAHAGVTEWIQSKIGRTGMLADVCRNYLGIALGVLLSWRWWFDEK